MTEPLKRKEFIVVVLLSIFLGMFGIDRFYLGKVGTGILKLVTFGGFGVWYLIDLLLLFTGNTRDNKGNELEGREKDLKIALIIFGIFILFGLIISFITPVNENETVKSTEEEKVSETEVNKPKDRNVLVDKVDASLNKLDKGMKDELASTSPTGYRGEIMNVESNSSDDVRVRVSTYFKDSGDGINGGQNIARHIFAMVCMDVPELNSLYVVSNSSGLESRSVYREQIPGCK